MPRSESCESNFQIVASLGDGSHSNVFLGKDETNMEIAIKAMQPQSVHYKREVKALSKLDHPNIVDMYGQDQDQGLVFMEYIPGTTLLDLVETQGALPEKQALNIISQVVDGIEYMCTRNVSHHDVKADNIIWNEQEQTAKIFDFSLAVHTEKNEGYTGRCSGSPNYMAPEVITNKYHNSYFSDIWSIGVLLYFLLAGELPWGDAETVDDLIERMMSGIIKFPETISEGCKRLIKNMLNMVPEKRPSYIEIRHIIGEILNGSPVEYSAYYSMRVLGLVEKAVKFWPYVFGY
eukprot:TRINITY_DN1962_c0_g2_i1.p1 TRINITY_DN1962_c0_g2~~TRINITY_DN1962_c0_g2_i1.p1  ORF type:complete len:291 (-),score=52.57 TRINITY_DN1962_c0_g2_i1:76-948(-)